ncbi:MAG: hypothetical protein HGA19_24585, partial [Oscillochloris sp.]|nr:hypothetical protein [Oscillochloris sp.]
NIPLAVRLEGALDVAALERTLVAIIERHEVLRTTFATLDGQLVQVITPAGTVPFSLPLSDLTHLPDVQREAELLRRADEESRQPFNLSRGPLFRANLLRLGPQEHVVLLTMHHIISDGWSMGVLMREIGAIYSAFSRGRPSPLPELPIQYADFASWQREHLAGDGLERQIDYWRQQLGPQGGPPPLELPTEYPRPAIFSSRGSSVVRQLPRDLVEQLRALSQREGATLFMTLLAGFQALLYRYSGQDDVCVGSPIANRTRAELEPLIGLFINTLVLRARLSPGQSFRSLLAQVRETTLGAYANQDLPFEQLVEALQPRRDMSHTPLFQVMLILQNATGGGSQAQLEGGLRLSQIESHSGTSTFDLTLSLAESDGGLEAAMEYCTDLFGAAMVERMLAHYEILLRGGVANPDIALVDLPLLSADEQRQLLLEWNPVPHSWNLEQNLAALFATAARPNLDSIAVIDPAGAARHSSESVARMGAAKPRCLCALHLVAKPGAHDDVIAFLEPVEDLARHGMLLRRRAGVEEVHAGVQPDRDHPH